jgi:hypothetical protein
MPRNKYLIPSVYIQSFFIIGLLSTLSIRLIIIVKHIDYGLVRVAWYFGIIGYILFFSYRYYITIKRKNLIIKHKLIHKINDSAEFPEEDKELLEYIVSSVVKSREHYNYLFIFVSSIIAIAIDILLENWA